jgi:hypothetical protein
VQPLPGHTAAVGPVPGGGRRGDPRDGGAPGRRRVARLPGPHGRRPQAERRRHLPVNDVRERLPGRRLHRELDQAVPGVGVGEPGPGRRGHPDRAGVCGGPPRDDVRGGGSGAGVRLERAVRVRDAAAVREQVAQRRPGRPGCRHLDGHEVAHVRVEVQHPAPRQPEDDDRGDGLGRRAQVHRGPRGERPPGGGVGQPLDADGDAVARVHDDGRDPDGRAGGGLGHAASRQREGGPRSSPRMRLCPRR